MAAAVLLDPPAGNAILEVGGEQALSGAQIAAIASKVADHPLVHLSVPSAALRQGMLEHGLPDWLVQLLVTFEDGIAAGELARPGDVVQQLTGRAPQSLAAFLQANALALKV